MGFQVGIVFYWEPVEVFYWKVNIIKSILHQVDVFLDRMDAEQAFIASVDFGILVDSECCFHVYIGSFLSRRERKPRQVQGIILSVLSIRHPPP